MKIGIVGSGGYYPLQSRAMCIVSYEMAEHLAELGHEVLVLVAIKNPRQRDEIRLSKRISFEFINTSFPQFLVKGTLDILRIFLRFRRECDIIHYNVPPYALEVFAPFFLQSRPQTYWYLGDLHDYPFRFSVFALNLRFINRIFACCNYTVDLLKKMKISPDKIAYVGEGVNVERFSSAKPLKLDGKPSILYVGRLDTRDKDLETLLHAFSIVNASIPNSRLHIIGGGGDENECKKYAAKLQIHKCVVWWGPKDHKDLPQYYKGADLVVYPISQYSSTGVGLVILEAMAARKPVITTSIPGNRELLRDGENALLSPPRDSKVLAEKIFMLCYDQEMAEKVANKGFLFAKEFDWEKVVLKLETSWKELLRARCYQKSQATTSI